MNKELLEKIKANMKKFSTDDLMKWRNDLLENGQMDNDILALFNAELLDRACERIEIGKSGNK